MDDEDETMAAGLPPELERLVTGTLVLMTTWHACPHPELCRKLIDNLTLIAQHRLISAPMRRVCANAATRWRSYMVEVERAIEADVAQAAGDDEDDAEPPGATAVRGRATLH